MSYLHRTWAEINLDALCNNFKLISSTTDSRIYSVVKANSYGHSVNRLAPLLDKLGTYGFAVSNINEAIELRQLGIDKPILILGYTPENLANILAEKSITQAVYSLEFAKKLDDEARKNGVTVTVHLKLDTGMGRIGFDCRDDSFSGLGEIKTALSLHNLNFEGVFTHFAVADSEVATDTAFTKEQFDRFTRVTELLERDGHHFSIKHCCNSAATLMNKNMHLDAVRPGIILYGLTPSTDIAIDSEFMPVMSFKTVVSMVKTVGVGDTISYGRTYTAESPRILATLSVGYADGYPRLCSNQAYVLIHGKKAPVVGRVCMDQMVVDVTDIEGVNEGDEALLFGDGLPVERVASWAGTINYETVCSITKRVPRIFFQNGKELDI